jgi:hypothetical protein
MSRLEKAPSGKGGAQFINKGEERRVREGLLSRGLIYTTRAGPTLGAFQHKCRVRR